MSLGPWGPGPFAVGARLQQKTHWHNSSIIGMIIGHWLWAPGLKTNMACFRQAMVGGRQGKRLGQAIRCGRQAP